MLAYTKENIDTDNIDYISGGERRDWFFSLIVADMLDKPHITLFKDDKAMLFYKGESSFITDIKGKKVLHIADIITLASSYTKTWIPAIEALGGKLAWSLVVVDRLQGGRANLEAAAVESHALVDMDYSIFEKAKDMGLINNAQLSMIEDYYKSPFESMKNFLLLHPEFMEQSLKSSTRDAKRARLRIDNDVYGIFK